MGLKSSSTAAKLNVRKYPSVLCFKNYCTTNIPETKQDVKQVIDTLRTFSDHDLLDGRHVHDLKDDRRFRVAADLVQKYSTVTLYSVDVGRRNGAKGNYRLIYYRDPEDGKIGQVISVYIDTHK